VKSGIGWGFNPGLTSFDETKYRGNYWFYIVIVMLDGVVVVMMVERGNYM